MHIALWLALGAGVGLAAAAFSTLVREHRVQADGVADLATWAFMVGDGVMLQKDGSLLAAFALRGPDLVAATDAERAALSEHVNDALLGYTGRWMIDVSVVRRHAVSYPASSFPSVVGQLIDEERREEYAAGGIRFESDAFLTVTYLPPADADSRLAAWFVQGAGTTRGVEWDQVLAIFERDIAGLARRLSTHLTLRRLGSDDLCTFLHRCLTGLGHRVRTPARGAYLNVTLADQQLVGGFAPRVGGRHVRVIAVQGYPAESSAGALSFLSELPLCYRWSTRVLPLDTQQGATLIKRHQLRWFQKRKGAGTWVAEMASKGNAAPKPEDALFADQDATSMAADAAVALAENASGRVRFAQLTQCVVVMEERVDEADRAAREILGALHDAGYTARIETVNALDAFLGTLPGNGFANVRRVLVNTLNVADLLPLQSTWPGPATNPSPYYPVGSAPLVWAVTAGSTPFRLDLHENDIGHTLIVGKTGGGKSTLVGLLAAQFQRHRDAQAFVFDVGYSGWLLCHATGGQHYDVAAGEGAGLSLQPLAEVDQPSERAWAADWLETVIAMQGVQATPLIRERIDRALLLIAHSDRQHRTLTEFCAQVQVPEVVAALRPYTAAGPYSVLDGSADTALSGRHSTFELKRLMDLSDAAVVPVTLALFRRVERALDGRPTLIVLEELWAPLMRSAFSAKIREWMLTLRKYNAAVVLVVHSPTQLCALPGAQLLYESCPTRLFLPNPDATSVSNAAAYAELGLNETEVSVIASAVPKRDYYLAAPRGRRLFQLGLGPVALAFLGTPPGLTIGETKAAVEALAARYGNQWPSPWLAQLGLDSWAARFDAAVTRSTSHSAAGARLHGDNHVHSAAHLNS